MVQSQTVKQNNKLQKGAPSKGAFLFSALNEMISEKWRVDTLIVLI